MFRTQPLHQSDLYNRILRQFREVHLKEFDVAVMVHSPKNYSSECDVEDVPKQPCPFLAEASAVLDVVANIEMFEDAEETMWKFGF